VGSPCTALAADSPDQCTKERRLAEARATDDHLAVELEDCPAYLGRTPAGTEWTEEERSTPLAFAIMAHRDGGQLAKLLAAVFRPWNSYCFQIDSKSSQKFNNLVQKLILCYTGQNPHTQIFLSASNISLVWQHSSLLEGDLSCLEQLEEREHTWEYFLNMVGSEFPLMTNLELVRRLRSSVEPGFVPTKIPWPEMVERFRYSVALPEGGSSAVSWIGGYYRYGPQKTNLVKPAPPHNLTLLFGIKNVAITRSFASFCLHSRVARDLRLWLQDVLVAVEHFFSTLAVVKVGKNGEVSQDYSGLARLNSFQPRQTFWWQNGAGCAGEWKREICNLALGDLPQILAVRDSFVVNKFDSVLHPQVTECLEEIVYPRM